MSSTVYELKLNNDRRLIPETAAFISSSASKLGLSERKVRFLCFTLETVLDYRTAAIDDKNTEINISVEDTGSYFKFSVTDFGRPYILNENQQKILRRKLVDKYSFQQMGRKGQCFSFLYKYDGVVPETNREVKEEVLLDDKFSFRAVQNTDEDVLEAVNCLYDSYGYDYYHQHLYSVESFRKYMENGRYVPIMAVNEHGQVMCYCALDENTWFLGVPEFANLVTKPIARGKGLANLSLDETERIAKEKGYEGIHVSAVAYHPYTQKLCNKHNYVPTAVEYSINPAGTGGYDADRRLDCVIAAKIFNKEKEHVLYLDAICNKLFGNIFDELGLNYRIENEIVGPLEESLIEYVVDTDTSNCFVKIDQCSMEIENELKAIFSSEEVASADVVTVNLNMNNKSAVLGFNALRHLGYICTGCIPGCINGDFMLFQHFRIKPEFDKIVVEPNYEKLIEEVFKVNEMK